MSLVDHVPWEALPLLPTLNVFRFLEVADLCAVSRVCHAWHDLSQSDEVWRESLRNISITGRRNAGESLKQLFARKAQKFRGISRWQYYYRRLRVAKHRLRNWLNTYAPHIAETMKKKALASEILRLESICSWIPDDMKVWWLLCRGQNFATMRGIFGGYKVYDLTVNMCLMDIVDATNMFQHTKKTVSAGKLPHWLTKCVPFATDNVGGEVIWSVAVEDITVTGYPVPTIPRGSVVAPCRRYRTCMPIAESFTALLEDWVDRLESGMHPVRDGEIQRFAEKNIPEAITNGVKIRASPLFIYEESLPGATYSWAYRIFMSMDESCQPADAYACQLTTRAWNIVDATGHVEQVRGPGVIGLYPKMFPGAEFSYESRCPLRVPSGTMEGWFEMRLKDGSVFNAIVPKFQFEVPKFIVEKNTSPKAE